MASTCGGLPHRLLLTTTRRPAVVAHWLPRQDLQTQVRALACAHAHRPTPQVPVLPRQQLAVRPTAAGVGRPAASASSLAYLAPRIRQAARWKTTQAAAAERTGAEGKQMAGRPPATSPAPDSENKVVELSLKEKVQLSEVRRLLQLARPERKTIAIAISLVCTRSRPVFSTAHQGGCSLTHLSSTALCFLTRLAIDPALYRANHRHLLRPSEQPSDLDSDCRRLARHVLCPRSSRFRREVDLDAHQWTTNHRAAPSASLHECFASGTDRVRIRLLDRSFDVHRLPDRTSDGTTCKERQPRL